MIRSTPLLISVFIFLLLSAPYSFASDDRSAEIAVYINQLHSPNITVRITAAKLISRSAITNPDLYAEVENNLQKALRIDSSDNKHIDEVAWLCKALASSGDPKYKETLREVFSSTSNSKIINYATQSYQLFDEYKRRNEVINDPTLYDDTLSPEENRIANMIRSDMIKLKREGAKIISRKAYVNSKIYDIVNDELLKNYANNPGDNYHVDAMAWLCKTLASSRDNKYISTFREILRSTSNRKLKKFAKKGFVSLSANR